jgi:hypothetical protein
MVDSRRRSEMLEILEPSNFRNPKQFLAYRGGPKSYKTLLASCRVELKTESLHDCHDAAILALACRQRLAGLQEQRSTKQ